MRRTTLLKQRLALSMATAASAILLGAAPVAAFDFSSPTIEAVFGFTGAVFKQIDPPTEGFEDNYLLGIGYQRGWGDMDGALYGVEAGIAGRAAGNFSVEAWGGVFGRYNFELGPVRIAPAFTFGLSAVTATMEGGETDRVEKYDGDGHLLFYLGPEVSIGLIENPDAELFARLHHRSGAWGTLGNVKGAADVAAVGFRSFF